MDTFKLLYQGKDIYPDIAVARCWVDGRAWGRLDRLTVDFGDVRNLWDVWHPTEGDEIAVEDGAARSGDVSETIRVRWREITVRDAKDNSLTVYLESEEDEKKDARALRSRGAEEGNADEKED